MTNQRADIISYPEFIKKSKKPVVGPAIWKWEDVHPRLMNEPSGAVSLVNKDVGESGGVSPTLNALFQVIKAGDKERHSHRHTNVALFLVCEGEGYSMIDDEKLEWKKGDLVLAPAWSDHGHYNTSDTEDAILFTFQDVPLVSEMGNWFIEEPTGSMPKHIVKKSDKVTK